MSVGHGSGESGDLEHGKVVEVVADHSGIVEAHS
jgi:hypothetical protein